MSLDIGREEPAIFLHPGDVAETRADVLEFVRDVGYGPATPVEEGVRHFLYTEDKDAK